MLSRYCLGKTKSSSSSEPAMLSSDTCFQLEFLTTVINRPASKSPRICGSDKKQEITMAFFL